MPATQMFLTSREGRNLSTRLNARHRGVPHGPRNEFCLWARRPEGNLRRIGLSGGRLLVCVTPCIPVGVGRRFQLVVGRLLQGDQGVVSFR